MVFRALWICSTNRWTNWKVHVRVFSHEEVVITKRNFFRIFFNKHQTVYILLTTNILYENLRHETWQKTDKYKGFQKKNGLQFTGISGLLWTMICASLEAQRLGKGEGLSMTVMLVSYLRRSQRQLETNLLQHVTMKILLSYTECDEWLYRHPVRGSRIPWTGYAGSTVYKNNEHLVPWILLQAK